MICQKLKNNEVFVVCQKNAWVDASTFIRWLKRIWFGTYPFRNVENCILFFDRATSHINDEVSKLFENNKCF